MSSTLRVPVVGGNWKMNTDGAGGVALAREVVGMARADAGVEVVIFPPLVYLERIGAAIKGSGVTLGSQDVYHAEKGAFTGEVSVNMLKDVGCEVVLAGHSERRYVMHEGDDLVNLKVRAALHHGMRCVLCVGEKLEQRETGQTDTVNERQIERGLRDVRADELDRLVIAYEPVWAIGTGKTASPEDAQSAHMAIRAVVGSIFGKEAAAGVRIQYGGSVTAANASELMKMPDVDGFLVGGASLKAGEFRAIIAAAQGRASEVGVQGF